MIVEVFPDTGDKSRSELWGGRVVRGHRGKNRKTSEIETGGSVTIGHVALAFIDLLSQKDVLRKINKLPESEEEENEFIGLWELSVGTIMSFRVAFDTFYKSLLEP